MSADDKFDRLAEEIIEKFLENNPDLAIEVGRHDPYDYLLPDGSPKRFLRNLELEENGHEIH